MATLLGAGEDVGRAITGMRGEGEGRAVGNDENSDVRSEAVHCWRSPEPGEKLAHSWVGGNRRDGDMSIPVGALSTDMLLEKVFGRLGLPAPPSGCPVVRDWFL